MSTLVIASGLERSRKGATPRLTHRRCGYRGSPTKERYIVATSTTRSRGIGLGGALVIAGIVIAVFWSLLLGIIVALVGLVAFGGFVKDKWY